MRPFLQQLAGFTAFFCVCAGGYFAARLHVWEDKDLIGRETYLSIKKSQKAPTHVRTLVLGDSTGNQLLPNTEFDGEVYSLCCNQAISLAGQYILLHEFLTRHRDPDKLDVRLLLRPSSLRNDLDQRFTYNYFLKPFDRPEFQQHLSPYVQAQLRKVPLRPLVQLPFLRNSRWSPNLQQTHKPHKFRISRLSAEYLRKMHSLCILNGVRSFQVRATFLSDEFSGDPMEDFQQDIKDWGLEPEMKGYFSTLEAYPATQFMHDKVHLLDALNARMTLLKGLGLE